MLKLPSLFALGALGFLLLPMWAAAHGLQVAAFADGARIEGSVYEPGGRPVSDARVTVRARDGRLLAELESDARGRFVYRATGDADLLIRAETLDGHAAEWTVTADEMAGIESGPEAVGGSLHGTESARGEGLEPSPELETLVERAVARQVRPLREQLIAYEDRVRLRDLLGGIGYILGLAGLALWWRSRGRRGGA